jgi:hypothetical protein
MDDHDVIQRIPGTLDKNTYISLGLVASVIGGAIALIVAIYSAKGDITAKLDRFDWRLGAVESNVSKVEKSQETWTDVDMFRWSVRLQRANEGKLIVPEVELHDKTKQAQQP